MVCDRPSEFAHPRRSVDRGDGEGGGRPDQGDHQPQRNKGGPREPDPLQTSVGYIGADSFDMERQRKKAGQRAFKAGLVRGGKPVGASRGPGGPKRGPRGPRG